MWSLICVVRRSMKSWASLVVMSFMAEEASFVVWPAVASVEGRVVESADEGRYVVAAESVCVVALAAVVEAAVAAPSTWVVA